jgi:tRNA(Ile)-lysidine synthase
VSPSIDDELLDVGVRAAEWRRELAKLIDQDVNNEVGTDARGTPTLDVAVRDLVGYPASVLAIMWPELASRAGLTLDARGTRRAVEFTMSSRAGRRIQLSGGWELVRSRCAFELRAALAGEGSAAGARALRRSMIWDRWSFEVDEQGTPGSPWRASLPTGEQLLIRAWRPGDRLTICHGGRLIARKVKYFLSDAGISGHIRRRWPVVVAGDEVVWIPGVRRSDAATARSGGPVVTYVCDYLDRRS